MPFYNEAATLRAALERLLKTDLPIPFEAVLVDDGSTDGGLDTVVELIEDERVKVVRKARNEGKGSALRAGLEVAEGSLVGVLDADLEYDPSDLRRLVQVILAGDATVVFGTRAFGPHAAASFWFVLGNKVTTLWASLLFNTWLSDIHTCLKIAPRPLWCSLGLRCDGFDVDPEATARFLKAGQAIYEVPISYRARKRLDGKKLRWTDGLRTIATLTRVRFSS